MSQPIATSHRPGRRTLVLIAIYVAWCALGYAVLLSSDWRYLWHVPLHALAVLLIWKPSLLRPRKARATVTHFLLIGVVYSAFVAEPLVVFGHGDLHPDLLLNGMLWLGSFAGIYLAWAWLLRRHRWHPVRLFALCGVVALFDQSLVLWKFLGAFDLADFLLFAPVLHAIYASMTAPVVIAYAPALEKRASAPGVPGHALAVAIPGTLFWLGVLWTALGRMLLDRVQ